MTRATAIAACLVLVLVAGCNNRLPDYVGREAAVPIPDGGQHGHDAGPAGFDAGPAYDAGASPFTPGVELRCTNLGAACRCSEPLDTNGWHDVMMHMVHWADPVDSPMATQCDGEVGGGSVWFPVDAISIALARGMPATSVRNDVWVDTPTGPGPSFIFGDAPAMDGSARLCTRVYVRFSSDYQPAGGACTESHQATFAYSGGGADARLALFDDGGGFHLHAYAFGSTADQAIPSGGVAVTPGACTSGWCRIEMCLAGNLTGGTGLTASAFVTAVGGGEQSFGPTAIGDVGTGAAGDAGMGDGGMAADGGMAPDGGTPMLARVLIADMTRKGTCQGTRSYSSAMQAEWANDSGQRIGSSAEIEGP